MQIITGQFKGRKLVAPKGEQTRPTLQRAKEAIFSILGEKVVGARVLDLFAGSGAFGAECASRGSGEVVMVDEAPEAKVAIYKNMREMKFSFLGLSSVHALNRLKNQGKKFDIIFLDPPYESDLGFESLRLIAKFGLLADDGIVVYETSVKNLLQKIPKSYIMIDERNYGIAKVLFLEQKHE